MSGYAKVFTSLFDGSLRGHPDEILVFVNMLCHADLNGVVDRHTRAIQDETGLSPERVAAAVNILESPDIESRTPDCDGRRIVRLDEHRAWGWQIVNHSKYRDLCSRQQNAERQKRYRGKGNSNATVTGDRYGALYPVVVVEDVVASGIPEGGCKGEGGGESEGYTLEAILACASNIGVPAHVAEAFHLHYAAVGFIDGAGRAIKSLPYALKKWQANQASHGRTEPKRKYNSRLR